MRMRKAMAVAGVCLFASTALAVPCFWVHPVGDHLVCVQAKLPTKLPIALLSPEQRAKMIGVSWHPGCPVGLDELASVTVPYVDPNGVAKTGEIIVAAIYAKAVQAVFIRLFYERFPIARIEPVSNFGGDDERSMAANNTSGFNCRPGPNKSKWSRHAYGDAIDLNPLWNPQVRPEGIKPPEGAAWVARAPVKPGMHVPYGIAVRAFRAIGWRWGGLWPNPKDYQHFTATGK